jgi:hypothetical protein
MSDTTDTTKQPRKSKAGQGIVDEDMVAEPLPTKQNPPVKRVKPPPVSKSEITEAKLATNRMHGPTLGELAPIVMRAENDANPPRESYYTIVTFMPQQQVRMHNPNDMKSAMVGMTAFKTRKSFHQDESALAEAFVEDLCQREKYFYHMIVTAGEWTNLMTDEQSAEKVGMKFAYSKNQAVLKEIMEGYYKTIEEGRGEIEDHVHKVNTETEMWKKLNKMEHDPSLLNTSRNSGTDYKSFPGQVPELSVEEKQQLQDEHLEQRVAKLSKFGQEKKRDLLLKRKAEQEKKKESQADAAKNAIAAGKETLQNDMDKMRQLFGNPQ